MDGNQTESYQDLIKQSKLTDIMENQIEIVDGELYTKENFLTEMVSVDQSINKIRFLKKGKYNSFISLNVFSLISFSNFDSSSSILNSSS